MGIFFRKSIKLGKHTRLNISKSGIGISAGVKGARIGINSKGKTYVAGGKDGIYFRKQLSAKTKNIDTNNMTYTREQLLQNDKLLRKHNNDVCNRAVIKLIKTCLIVFFLVAIGDAFTLQSTILLEVVGVIDVVICFGTMFYILKKMLKSNKEGKLIDEGL